MKPTIVVIAYNRPYALQRLLGSLQRAEYPADTRLIISIDGGGEHGRDVQQIAAQFQWPAGEKKLIQHQQNLGLTQHVFACGDLSQKFGSIILLEDDLFVSPMFYHFATQTLAAYADDSRIAGISLNALWFNGYTHQPFIPYLEDADAFFLQVAWYQGQAYSQQQWASFMDWRETAVPTISPSDHMHESFQHFPKTDWFPFKTKFLVQTNRTYVFPRESLTTNFGDAGTHFARPTPFFQVPLQTFRCRFRLRPYAQAVAVYDSFQEMLPNRLNRLTEQFMAYDYAIDLYGTKSAANCQAEYLLTTKPCRQPLFTFGQVMWPLEANVVTAVPGTDISFARTENLDTRWPAAFIQQSRNHQYFTRQRKMGVRQWLKLTLGKFMKNWA